ncbi:MAG TPA: hypothetical protein VI758_10400 [Bacteroidota bacterium]
MSGRARLAMFFVFSLVGSRLSAQLVSTDDHIGTDFLQPQLTAGYSAASERLFKDIDGRFDASTASIAAAVPVYRSRSTDVSPSGSCFVLARGSFSSLKPEISFLPSADVVYRTSFGMTAGISTTGNHLYLLTLEVGMSEDGRTISNPRLRPTGSLVGKYHLDDSFAFFYGLSYSYTFNRGLVLPLLGTRCVLATDLQLHMILPLSMEIDYQEAPALHFGLVVRAEGDQIHFDDRGIFGPQTLPLYIKIAQVQGAVNVSVGLGDGFWLDGEAGMLRGRKFAVGTLNDNLVSSDIENSGYSTIMLKYELGPAISWGN